MTFRYTLVLLLRNSYRCLFIVLCTLKYARKVTIICFGVDAKIHPSGFMQQRSDSTNFVTAYAAMRPRDGFSYTH